MIRSSAATALLVLGCVLAVQASFLVAQVARTIEDLHGQAAGALSNADRTLAIIRATTEQQRGSYEEIARHTARSLAALAQLIERTDERMERLTAPAEDVLRNSSQAMATFAEQQSAVGGEAAELLAESRAALKQFEQLADSRQLQESAASMARSTANLERMSAAAADSSERVRDILSPAKKSFWRRLLELMIPRPTIRIGK